MTQFYNTLISVILLLFLTVFLFLFDVTSHQFFDIKSVIELDQQKKKERKKKEEETVSMQSALKNTCEFDKQTRNM